MKLLGILVVALSTLTGCSDALDNSCAGGEMRCYGSMAQMCQGQVGGGAQWEDFLDCSYYGETCTEHCAYSGIACCT